MLSAELISFIQEEKFLHKESHSLIDQKNLSAIQDLDQRENFLPQYLDGPG